MANIANQRENFRTLSLISHTAKLLTIIISKTISKRIDARLTNDQYGFRKNKETREAILGLKIILEKQIERQKNHLYGLCGPRKSIR